MCPRSTFATDFEKLSDEILDALGVLMQTRISSGELETLRMMKNAISEFETQVDGARRVLMAMLDNEEDMRLLYLTKVGLCVWLIEY